MFGTMDETGRATAAFGWDVRVVAKSGDPSVRNEATCGVHMGAKAIGVSDMAARRKDASKAGSRTRRQFSRKELERLSGERLPKREAMSAVTLLGHPIAARTLPPA